MKYKLIKNTKRYFLIVFFIIFFLVLIINISIHFTKTEQKEINPKNAKSELEDISFNRKLDFYNDSLEVCSKSSQKLINYFLTGDINYVKFYTLKNYNNNPPPKFIYNLINILKGEDLEDNVLKYISHLAPLLIFLIIAILSIPGWITCIICSVCDCRCCCCLKKQKLKLLFFFIISLMILLIIILSLIGLGKIRGIFKDIRDAECSVLKFINEALLGESKTELPKWGGIEYLFLFFDYTIYQLREMSTDEILEYIGKKNKDYINITTQFENVLINASKGIFEQNDYKISIFSRNYILDIAKKFGEYYNGNFTEGSYADKWIKQAVSKSVENSYNELGNIIRDFLNTNLEKAKNYIIDLETDIEEIKNLIGKKTLDYSKKADKYGKIILYLLFILLLLFSIFIEVLVIYILFCINKKSYKICEFTCLKIILHIFWNIFAFLMIIVLIIGCFFTLSGYIGEDCVEVINYLISEKNLESNSSVIFGERGYILNECINGDGVISDDLGIDLILKGVEYLKNLIIDIDSFLNKIMKDSKTDEDSVYNELISEINKRQNLEIDFGLVPKNLTDISLNLMLKETISKLNNALKNCNINERWSISCNIEFPNITIGRCNSNINENKCIDPSICYNQINNRYSSFSSSCTNLTNFGYIIYTIFNGINYAADNITSSKINSIKQRAINIKKAYKKYINESQHILSNYTYEFKPITIIYDNFIGNQRFENYINCGFIRRHAQVMLYYIEEFTGKQLKKTGIILLIIGFAMAISISLIILLISIVNFNMEEQNKEIDKNNISALNKTSHVYSTSSNKIL